MSAGTVQVSASAEREVIARFRQLRLIPVIVIEEARAGPGLGRALAAGGLPIAEVTFRTAAAREALTRMSAECPDVLTGAGTVLTTAQAAEAHAAGAKFVVAPGFNPAVVEYCQAQGMPVFPGIATPSEVEAALSRGLTVLKFFPAEPLGGVEYLKAISAPYGAIEFVPTGGITAQNAGSYLSFYKVLACGGSWMAPADMIAAGAFDRITSEVRNAVEAIKPAIGALNR